MRNSALAECVRPLPYFHWGGQESRIIPTWVAGVWFAHTCTHPYYVDTHQLQSGNGCCSSLRNILCLVWCAALSRLPFSPRAARNDGCQLLLSGCLARHLFYSPAVPFAPFPALGSLLQPFHQQLGVMIFKHDMLQPSSRRSHSAPLFPSPGIRLWCDHVSYFH
jgi:hypothetical protein